MTKYAVELADASKALKIADNMRQADRDEIWAAAHTTPEQAVLLSLFATPAAKIGTVNGEPVIIFGVGVSGTALTPVGIPWMLATDELDHHSKAFLRRCKKAMEEMKEGHALLVNWVDARNTKAIKWLKWLGFEVHDPKPHGIDGLPFHRFEMRV